MIASLAGVVEQRRCDGVVLDVNGVGYLCFASARTLARVPAAGEPMRLLVETHVREDHIHLYGFADEGERGAFRLLTTVQGVGAKLALAILSVLAPDALTTAIMAQDIVNELKDKVGGIALGPAAQAAPAAAQGAAADAVSALVNLGYSRSDAFSAITQVTKRLGAEARIDALIRAGLQELAR